MMWRAATVQCFRFNGLHRFYGCRPFQVSSLNGYAVSMPAAFLVSWAAPVSVETQNFASVHKESRHDAIVRFDGLRPFDDLKK